MIVLSFSLGITLFFKQCTYYEEKENEARILLKQEQDEIETQFSSAVY